jgi:hypothetical protein
LSLLKSLGCLISLSEHAKYAEHRALAVHSEQAGLTALCEVGIEDVGGSPILRGSIGGGTQGLPVRFLRGQCGVAPRKEPKPHSAAAERST